MKHFIYSLLTLLILNACSNELPEPNRLGNFKPRNINGFIYMGTFQKKDYYCSTSTYTWKTAEALVNTIPKAEMVAINSAAENAAVVSYIDRPPFPFTSAWIGLTDEYEEGNFRWTNNEAVNYLNWGPGEPNNTGFPGCIPGTPVCDEHFVHIHPSSHIDPGSWNDATEFIMYKVIIETPSHSYPVVQVNE